LEGTTEGDKKTTIPALFMDTEFKTYYKSSINISNIDFVAKEGIKVSRGDRQLSCGVLVIGLSLRMTESTVSGYEVGVYATESRVSLCRFENNDIGYLLSADELDPSDVVYDGISYFMSNVKESEFINNGIGLKVEKLPKGATALKIAISANNFIDNERDMDMANGDLGALFYAYNNYFGWTVLGVPTPRTAIVELGKDTIVLTNPRRWAPYGSGDDRLYIDILYPGVTWIVNSQSGTLKIAEDLIDTEDDTELVITDDQGNKVGKWKFEGGKNNK
jgi:hypothetical protein